MFRYKSKLNNKFPKKLIFYNMEFGNAVGISWYDISKNRQSTYRIKSTTPTPPSYRHVFDDAVGISLYDTSINRQSTYHIETTTPIPFSYHNEFDDAVGITRW